MPVPADNGVKMKVRDQLKKYQDYLGTEKLDGLGRAPNNCLIRKPAKTRITIGGIGDSRKVCSYSDCVIVGGCEDTEEGAGDALLSLNLQRYLPGI